MLRLSFDVLQEGSQPSHFLQCFKPNIFALRVWVGRMETGGTILRWVRYRRGQPHPGVCNEKERK